jgi:hypothetical protein
MNIIDFHGRDKIPADVDLKALTAHIQDLLLQGSFEAFPGRCLKRILVKTARITFDGQTWRLIADKLMHAPPWGGSTIVDMTTGDVTSTPTEMLFPCVGKQVFAKPLLGTVEYPVGTGCYWPEIELYAETFDSGGWPYGGWPELRADPFSLSINRRREA